MDKQILKKLIDFGLITNICVDADKYETVDELINAGIITIPGSRNVIDKLIGEVVESPEVETEEMIKSSEEEVKEVDTEDENLDTKSVEVVSPVEEVKEVDTEEDIESVEEAKEDIESVEEAKPKKTKKTTK
jgi:hypothetical protein